MSPSSAKLVRALSGLVILCVCSCAGLNRQKQETVAVANPAVIKAVNEEAAWEQMVDVLHRYHFTVERENRQARTMETAYRVGSGLFEPWHKESVGWRNRWESTLQSVRRKVVVTIMPLQNSRQQFAVQVVALKELEDLNALAANSPGGATFQESTPLERDLSQVVGQSRPSGWVPQGRDLELERALLADLQKPKS